MAELPSSQIQSSVLAVLQAVKDAGLPSVTRTALVKLVYLLDCLHAEEHGGQTASQSRWYFDKFGPFAKDLVTGIDTMAHVGMLQSRNSEVREGDFTLYWLGEFPRGPRLRDLGLSIGNTGRFEQWVRKYSKDLPKLLDYVYFNTAPMEGATPGRALSFDLVANPSATGPYEPIRVSDQGRLFRLLELSHRIGQAYEAATDARSKQRAPAPIYDETYKRAMIAFDEQDAVEDLSFRADLHA